MGEPRFPEKCEEQDATSADVQGQEAGGTERGCGGAARPNDVLSGSHFKSV